MSKLIISNIEIEVTKKNIKNIHLSVNPPNGSVHISAPKKMDDEAIKLFALSKLKWIKKHQARFEQMEIIPEREYITGETYYFRGRGYLLNIIYGDNNRPKIEIRDETYMDLYIKTENIKEQRKKIMTEWYRKELKKLIPPLIEKWEKKMNVTVTEFGVKRMKTRWGTCNISAKRIWINLELAKKSPECLEYIIVHEMAHLLERGHGTRFVALMDKFLPNWREIKAELNQQGMEPD